MSSLGSINFTGASGKRYGFSVYAYGQEFRAVGAVYVVTKATRNGNGGLTHTVLYVGETGDLSERFDDHHKAVCFRRNGANRICVRTESSSKSRQVVEEDLIGYYAPHCNG